MKPLKILVTGGAGFIGSAVCRYLIEHTEHHVAAFDKLTYAGNLDSLAPVEESDRYSFIKGDICDSVAVRSALDEVSPDIVMHLAAESHVDRSIDGPAIFIETNIVGTSVLLQEALSYWRALTPDRARRFRFHHVSTDEVFGSLGQSGYFTEDSQYAPNSPYSASKASSDHLVRAWHETFGLPTLLTNCSNNYGPFQFPEKLIPLMILAAIEGAMLPVYGSGANVRDWLHVDDHARALVLVAEKGEPGQSYAIGGQNEKTNLEVVEAICDMLNVLRPRADGASYREQIAFVADRPGHDARYAIDASKIERELGWKRLETFESGLEKTVHWYLNNEDWWSRVRSGAYRGQRLGLG